MKILKFEYYDKLSGWHLNPVDFSSRNLALLVGVSGVGKTLILKALMNLKEIAKGNSKINGLKWNIVFSTATDDIYHWQGEYEDNGICEKISIGDDLIVERDGSEIKFDGQSMPKLSPFESAIKMFNQEDLIKPAYHSLNNLYQSSEFGLGILSHSDYDEIIKEYELSETFSGDDLPFEIRLALAQKYDSEVFEKIKKYFMDIFPQTEDLKVEAVIHNKFPEFVHFPLRIKEKNVADWISEGNISSGMLKTFRHISEIFLLPEDSLILIDEFENSLGVNCIDVLTEIIFHEKRDLQFIITSHHPYIINNIDPKYWKIVTRKGGEVFVKDAKEFGLGKTKHSAFTELTQLEAYTDGIEI